MDNVQSIPMSVGPSLSAFIVVTVRSSELLQAGD